jgi:hypothetical protein
MHTAEDQVYPASAEAGRYNGSSNCRAVAKTSMPTLWKAGRALRSEKIHSRRKTLFEVLRLAGLHDVAGGMRGTEPAPATSVFR